MKFYIVTARPYLKLRIFATLIDYSIFTILCFLYISTFGQKTDWGGWELNGLPVLLVPLYWFLYFVILETTNQATPGHDIVKLKIVKSDGYKPSFTDIFKRRICDLIDIGFYGIPAIICVLKTPKHQRIGDLWANTMVIKASDIEEKEVAF